MNNRRKLLMLLGAAMLAAPPASLAQQPAGVARIGYLMPSFTTLDKARPEMFRQALQDLRYVEGKNFVIEQRSADGKHERLAVLAAELVGLKMDVIVAASGTPTTLALKNATKKIPIVFPTLADPVAQGIVTSLARPGGNLTGMSLQSSDTGGKRLQLVREIVPNAKRVAILVNPNNASHVWLLKETQAAASSLGLDLHVVEARVRADFDAVFAALSRNQSEALIVFDDGIFAAEASALALLAARWRMPMMGGNITMPESGGLASYGPDRLEMYRRAAFYVDKILKGAKPADIPVELVSKFDLVINMKAARALGITIPQSVLLRADRVLQ